MKSKYQGLAKQKKKLQTKNKEYKRSLSNLGASTQHVEDYFDKMEEEEGKDQTSKIAVKWEYLTLSEKLKLFNPWCLVIMISNVLQVIGTASLLLSRSTTLSFSELLIGLGCFSAWVGVLRFLDTNQKLYSAPSTIKNAAPVILRILVGVIPIYIGFCLLGMCLFWHTDRFKTPSAAFFSLFSMMYGDVIRETYVDVSFGRYLTANLF